MPPDNRSHAFVLAVSALFALSVMACVDVPTVPELTLDPQLAKGGNGGGGKPGGGSDGSAATSLIFRDAGTDGLTSDTGTAYEGSFESAGFAVTFGRRSNRSISMDFGSILAAGDVDVPSFLADGAETPASLEIYRDDGSGTNLPLDAMTAGEVSDARMSVYFDDPEVRRSEWTLSMADKTAGWFGSVECLADDGSSCTTWRVAPGPDARLRLLLDLTMSAGEYAMPFEALICAGDETECRALAGY